MTIVLRNEAVKTVCQMAGGARGATLRRTTTGTVIIILETSSCVMAGTMDMIREGVEIAVADAEQIGHTCESIVLGFNSTQQWIFTARKATPMSKVSK